MSDWALPSGERIEAHGPQSVGVVGVPGIYEEGGWVQIAAATSFDYAAIQLMLNNSTSTATRQHLDFAVGPAGNERIILENLLVDACAAWRPSIGLRLPIHVPAGSRLAARQAKDSSYGASRNMDVTLVGIAGGFGIAAPSAGEAITYGALPATVDGTLVDAGPTLNMFGAWTEITAATARQHSYIAAVFGTSSIASGAALCNVTWQLAIGPAGSEQPIAQYQTYISNSNAPHLPASVEARCSIPEGTRLSMRCRNVGNLGSSSRSYTAVLYGV